MRQDVTQSDAGRVPERVGVGRKKGDRCHLEEMGRGTEKHKAPSDEGAPFLSRGCAWGRGR